MSNYATYPSLRDRRVLVTGGASGIGRGIVEHFAAQGSQVGFIDLDEPAAAEVVEANPGVCFARADLRDIPALRRARSAAAGANAFPTRCTPMMWRAWCYGSPPMTAGW